MQELTFEFQTTKDCLELYQCLFNKPSGLLLESKDPLSKQNRQSLIGIEVALKIIQHDLNLKLEAQNENGQALLEKIAQSKNLTLNSNTLVLSYKKNHHIQDEEERLKAPHPLEVITLMQKLLKPLPQVLIAGNISFDYLATFENIEGFDKLPPSSFPNLSINVYDVALCCDHLQNKQYLIVDDFSDRNEYLGSKVTLAQELILKINNLNEDLAKLDLKVPNLKELLEAGLSVDLSDEVFSSKIKVLKEHILNGDLFQVVPARTFSLPLKKPLLAYRFLSLKNPSPYMFYIKERDYTLFGTSPEFALRFDAPSREIAISPIAGTRPRPLKEDGSVDELIDKRVELELRTNQKELAEHIMLVDLARNDLSRIAKTSSVHVDNLLYIVKYQHVMHLVSDVKALLREDLNAHEAYLSVMNMGTLSGAPKLKAHELIYKTEGKRRNFYGGVMARFLSDGSLDSCIVIRSALVKEGQAFVQAGCGIIKDSDEKAECEETFMKAKAVLNAIYNAQKSL